MKSSNSTMSRVQEVCIPACYNIRFHEEVFHSSSVDLKIHGGHNQLRVLQASPGFGMWYGRLGCKTCICLLAPCSCGGPSWLLTAHVVDSSRQPYTWEFVGTSCRHVGTFPSPVDNWVPAHFAASLLRSASCVSSICQGGIEIG